MAGPPDRFSFVVARLGTDPPLLSPTQIQPDKLEHFASEPGLTPPRITVLKHSSGFSNRIFLTPLPSPIVHPGSTHETVTLTPVGPGRPDDRRRPGPRGLVPPAPRLPEVAEQPAHPALRGQAGPDLVAGPA